MPAPYANQNACKVNPRDKRFLFCCDSKELDEWRREAGSAPLAAWIRGRLNDDKDRQGAGIEPVATI